MWEVLIDHCRYRAETPEELEAVVDAVESEYDDFIQIMADCKLAVYMDYAVEPPRMVIMRSY